jgi:hypothetical protein
MFTELDPKTLSPKAIENLQKFGKDTWLAAQEDDWFLDDARKQDEVQLVSLKYNSNANLGVASFEIQPKRPDGVVQVTCAGYVLESLGVKLPSKK